MEALVAGRLWREIAAELGVNRTSLRKELVAAGYNPCGQKRASKGRASKGRRARFSDDEVRAIYARQLAGERLDKICLLYTSDAADERSRVDLGGRRIIKKKI